MRSASRSATRLTAAFAAAPAKRAELPDGHALFRRQIKRVAWLNVKRFVPSIHVAGWPVDAIARGRVWACHHLIAQGLFALQLLAMLRAAHEETLQACRAFEHRWFFAIERNAIGVKRDLKPAAIADVLTEREAAIQMQPRQRLELRVLIGQTIGHFAEAAHVVFVPPIAQHAVRI